MPFTIVPLHLAPSEAGFSFALTPPSVGAAQRAGLARGLAAVLMLAVSCLLVVYAPLAWCERAALDVRAVAPLPREAAALRLPPGVARIQR